MMGTTPRVRALQIALLSSILFAAAYPRAAHARVFDAHVGLGPRIHDEATGGGEGTSAEGVAVVRAAVAVDDFLDATAEVHGVLQDLGGGEITPTVALVGFNLRAPLPGPIGVEAGVSAGMIRPTGADEPVPLFAYQFALGGSVMLIKWRVAYEAAFGTPADDDPDGAARARFGHNLLFMVGLGL